MRGEYGIAAEYGGCEPRRVQQRAPRSLPPVGRTRTLLVLGFAPAQLLDIAGPAEVFAQAGRQASLLAGGDGGCGRFPPLYDVALHVVPGGRGCPPTSTGLCLSSTVGEDDLLRPETRIDTLLVAGGEGARTRAGEPGIERLVRHLAPRARRVASVCTGAFPLAAAGLLDGRRAATHWRWAADLARRFPRVRVEAEPIHVRDGRVWSSAGISAGIDLALALVEEDHGHALALAIARELVLFLRRPGGQKQFSPVLAAQARPRRQRLADLVPWLAENMARPLAVPAMAAEAGMSPRHFARAFAAEMGETPARMLERLRVEAAQRRLEEDGRGLASVAAGCGFGTEETMRRAFLRHLGAPPGGYRARFGRKAEDSSTGHQPKEASRP